MHLPTIARAVGLIFAALATSLSAAPKKVSFSQPQPAVEAYDYLEVVAQIEGADAANPFTDATPCHATIVARRCRRPARAWFPRPARDRCRVS